MTWQDYEVTVKNIYEALGKNYGVKIEGYGNACKRKGKSGVDHQIDVLTSHTDGVHTYLTAIECKYWNEKVNKDMIMKLIEIIDDCNIDKAVIVSKKGFTPDARSFALFKKVQLVELSDRYFSSDNKETEKYYIHSEVIKSNLCPLYFEFDNEIRLSVNESEFLDGDVYNHYYECIDGSIISNNKIISDFLNSKVLNSELFAIITDKIVFPEGTKIKKLGSEISYPIISLTLSGYNENFTVLDVDYFENKVWLVMKVLFEEKNFIIKRNGEIENMKANKVQIGYGTDFCVTARFFSKDLVNGSIKPIKVRNVQNAMKLN